MSAVRLYLRQKENDFKAYVYHTCRIHVSRIIRVVLFLIPFSRPWLLQRTILQKCLSKLRGTGKNFHSFPFYSKLGDPLLNVEHELSES